MSPDIQARFDRLDRNISNLDATIHLGHLNGREIHAYRLRFYQKQVFLNIVVISMIFTFSVIAAFFNTELFCLGIALGFFGCMYTASLIQFVARMTFYGETNERI